VCDVDVQFATSRGVGEKQTSESVSGSNTSIVRALKLEAGSRRAELGLASNATRLVFQPGFLV
jgi:hypothetical protein